MAGITKRLFTVFCLLQQNFLSLNSIEMTPANKTHATKEKEFLFEAQLNWLSKHRGILTSHEVKDTIHVATPPVFGGEGHEWSPEHLFLGSLSSCFMSTYLLFAKKLAVDISRFECDIIGRVQLVEGKFQFTIIDIYPRIHVVNEESFAAARLALEKTQKYCLVSNSVSAELIYHPEILKDLHPRHSQESIL
jgi:organic hydroperoxide reductase OsmC/OhrA